MANEETQEAEASQWSWTVSCGGSTLPWVREEPILHPRGRRNATRNRHTRKQDSSISANTIKRGKTHSLSLFCPFAQRPPVDVHCTLITVARPVCIVLRCSHEDGWSQAGSKGKCEALVIVYRHEWMANGNDIDIASSCHHASSSLIERHLERLKRLCICNETLRRESKFAEVAQRHSAEVSWNQNGYALDASFSISSCCHVVLEL